MESTCPEYDLSKMEGEEIGKQRGLGDLRLLQLPWQLEVPFRIGGNDQSILFLSSVVATHHPLWLLTKGNVTSEVKELDLGFGQI